MLKKPDSAVALLAALTLMSCNSSGSFGVDGSAADPVLTGDAWQDWGTRGSTRTAGISQGGFALCGYADVRTDDLTAMAPKTISDALIRSGKVQSDALGECGDSAETLSWRLVNCERISRQLTPFSCDLRLVGIARAHSVDMRIRDYISHTTPEGLDPGERLVANNIAYTANAENISFGAATGGFTLPDIATQSHYGLMDSDGHRNNILSKLVSYAGCGVSYGTSQEFNVPAQWITQVFITPK